MIAALASLLVQLAAVPRIEADASAAAPGTPGAWQAPAWEPPAGEAPPPPTAVPARLGEAQLAPAFAPGTPAAEGKAAYDAGRFAEAVGKLQRAPEPEAAYVRALALLELGRPLEVARALDGLETALPELSDRVAFLRAEALASAGQKQAAVAGWAALPEASLLAPQARLARARISASLGDRPSALSALAPLLARPPPADLSHPDLAAPALLLSGRLRSAGPSQDLGGARRDFLSCWVAHPLAPESAECLTALRSMAMPFGVPPGPEEVLQRAENLLDQNRNATALGLLESLAAAVRGAAPDEPLACRIRAALGRAERRERNHARAVELLRPVVESCADPALRVRALFVLAGSTALAGDRAQGIALYRRLAREHPGHALADDALLAAAQLLGRDGQEAEAGKVLGELIEAGGQGDQLPEARFLRAWLARRTGDVEGALSQLEAIERAAAGVDPYEQARAAYWRARTLWERGPEGREAARRAYADLALRVPTDYYGLLARVRLAEAGDAPPRPRPALPVVAASYDPGSLRDDPHLRAGLLLFRMGLPRAATDELEAVPLSRLEPGASLDPVLLVADVLDRMGEHRAAHGLLRTRAREAFRRAPDADNLRAWQIAYPSAFREEVERAARSAAIPADLVQALMREESALDPRVISPAGAVGLTQLMLPTAQQVAARLRLSRPARADLMVPALNLRLGASYLGDLVRRYGGEVALALAAYNAGAGAVDRWREAMPGLPLDEFVEQIPVDETRGYVKRVLRSYSAYATLRGEGQGSAAGILRVAKE